ncbi:MAG: hypothetical protein MPW14_15535 [Candidatus Manganitrophus sp.]|nr:MAG: hypothetical protein MPW14_15535 [Candidatus Manganitrophus sp.]
MEPTWLMVVTALIAFPLGIAAATYLEEYSRKNWLTDFIEINIANLAGVPSIVYGLLALGLFVYTLGESRPEHPVGCDDVGAAGSPDRHRRHARVDPGDPRARFARAPTPSARASGRWSAITFCRRRCRAF